MSSKKRIYFFEGETEKKLLDTLKAEQIIPPGQTRKFNLWTGGLDSILRRINIGDKLFFVIDTDCLQSSQNFINNIKGLNRFNFCIIVQHENLEDELVKACGKNNTNILFRDFYSCTSSREFKSGLLRDNRLMQRLRDNNFDEEMIWSRVESFCEFILNHDLQCSSCKDYPKYIKVSSR